MEVENWIADLPQYLDTTGPLDKRRIRDAVVKKIQEVEANVNCNENAFADHLKTELPKYIERIPIKEDINVNFVIDELVNRIRNLDNMKSRPRYVSFQEPQDYEDFVRDVPRASSFHETPGQNDPRSWVPRNASSPLDDKWQSMQATRAPADLRDWSQTTQSEPFAYTQNGPSQVVTTPSYSLNDYGSPRHLPSVSPAQFPLGQEYYNSIAQSAIPPLHHPNAQNGHHPNALKQVDPNNPGDYSQPSTSPFISPGGYIPRMAGQRGVHPGVAVSSPSPQPYGQVNLNPYSCNSNFSDGRCRGPITKYYQEQYQHPVTPLRGNQMHSRGMPVPPTRAPQAPYGQSQLIPQNLQEPIETQRPTYFPGSYIDPLLQNSPYQQPIEAVSRPSIPQPQVPQVQGVPANIFSSRQVPYTPTSEQIPQFAYAQDVPNDTTTPYQAPIGSLFTFPDQGPQYLPDISAPQFKRYTQGTSVAPQERRPLVPHFSKGPIGPVSMKTFVKPSLSSQGRFSLGHYGQSNSNDPINIIPDSRRTSQISAVNPKERHFSESSKKSVSNSQYLAPEVEMGSSKKPVDLQERDHTESYIQNVPNKYAETAPTTKTQSKVPAASLQVTQYSDRQKQFVPNDSDSQSEFKIDSKEQAVPQEIRKSKPDEQTYANDKDKIVPSNQSDSIPPVIPFDGPLSPRQQSGKSGRDISTQVSLRDTEASPQDVTSEQKPWRLSTKVSPKIQYDSHPSDQTYSELPTVVLEGPGPQDLHELKPPSASSAPVSTIPSLDHGSQPPNKQGNSVLSSFKSGGQNKIQSEPIPSAFKERQPNLTTIGDTEVSHERPGRTSADISEVIPYDQMAPKGYSSPTSKTFEPAFQMDPSSPLQTGDVIPESQISPENVKTQPQTNDITPETQLIQDNQGSQLHSKHPIRSNQIPFNDLQNVQSDFVPFSQAIEIEIWSPIHVEQYPPTVTYEYIPDSISFEKTHFSIQTAKSPALVSAASQAPEEILEVHLPGVVRDGRMYGTGKEPGPSAPESIEAVRKKRERMTIQVSTSLQTVKVYGKPLSIIKTQATGTGL
ncbi:hypothetical protein HF086_003925 [Spodoptera exigua]|uniref:Uncharacterized protein n=1 Tax=Spodoptera exigua TaxID=7107 RepID=A0A922MB25_SPOEX|nr:hypothetical protein HF086_003925 [Spodoptera exigua]